MLLAKRTVQVICPEAACRAESAGAISLLRLQQGTPHIRFIAGPQSQWDLHDSDIAVACVSMRPS